MMIFGLRSVATAFLLTATIFAAVPQASAQSTGKAPIIGLVNYLAIIQNSKAGKSVNDQVVKQRELFLAEIKKVEAELEKEGKELEQQQSVLAKEVFEAKVLEFRRKQREAQQAENGYRRALDQMQAKGLQLIEKELDQILEAIAEERGIDIVMKAGTPNSMILKARKELFITDEVIKRLDSKLPTVKIPPSAQ